ncbi:tol-pal system protein YbgF [Nitrosomonas marina]|uniref:Cell division coordinator CpoB n=1 Tax=Nitrosomonas marina TaxID=917 RepID=A0A1H8CL15_9PROT|nr:tol-pal system protein YbgF [Nitrosomonas marina]SEM95599.1 tol-pal system protein YbgF [Nitrosomonas marina]
MLIRVFCVLVLMFSNVSHAGLFGDDKAREQINTLRQQVEEMEARIAEMEEALKSQALLELYTQVETLGMELGRLRGQIEMLNHDNASLQKRQKDFYIDLDSRLRQIEDPDAPPPTYGEPANDTPPAETTERPVSGLSDPQTTDYLTADSSASNTESRIAYEESPGRIAAENEEHTRRSAAIPNQDLKPAGTTEKQTYDAAFQLFTNGDYRGAKSQFETFLKQHPHSSLAPSAAYWIGNAYYALRDFQDAIRAQQNLIDRYPDSSKVPDALLNIASSQNELADGKAARKTLEELIAQYPFSNAAEKAKQRLDRL